jgi:hypothetical protein
VPCPGRVVLWEQVELQDVRYPIFLALLEYLYTDDVAIDLEIAMELFQVGRGRGPW